MNVTVREHSPPVRGTKVVISGFGRYQTGIGSLPPGERAKVTSLGQAIRASFRRGATPVRVIRLIGHADADPSRGHEFERQISGHRAVQVERALAQVIADPTIVSRIAWRRQASGATRPVVVAPASEAARRRNRRVEVMLEPGVKPVQARVIRGPTRGS